MKVQIPEQFKQLFVKLDEKNRYYVFGGILLFVFLLDYLIIMRPQLGTLAKISPEIKLLVDDVTKAKVDIDKLLQYKSEVEKLRKKVEGESKKVRSREEVTVVLEQISRLAIDSGLRIEQITPNSAEQKLILDTKERKYYSLPISIDAKSGYHHFGKFLNQFELEGIFLTVKTFNIASVGESKLHNLKLTLNALVYDEIKPGEKK